MSASVTDSWSDGGSGASVRSGQPQGASTAEGIESPETAEMSAFADE